MKQHLLADQLKEISYEERITLLSIVTGLTKEYVIEEYEKRKKEEEGMLRAYGYNVNIGEMIEIIENYTAQFPAPILQEGAYCIKVTRKNQNGDSIDFVSEYHVNYCDALYEIVKQLLREGYIE